MTYQDFFKGKRVTILGLGLLGRGVGDAAFLADCGAIVTVTDKKTEADLSESIAALEGHSVTFHLGGHQKEDFTDTDMVIKAAGVPLDSPEIAAAQKAGVPMHMSTALFAKFAAEMGATIVGVTGTRGKTTVSHMIHHAIQQAEKRAHLGGNIRGVSTLAMLPEIQKGDIAVLELDSWQLQGFGELKLSPHVAVFTNFMPDHQNYYPDMDAYFRDKANIFKYQTEDDILIVGSQLPAEHERRLAEASPRADMKKSRFPGPWNLKILGAHNKELAGLAAVALESLGISEAEIKHGLESFEGVEGRLQLVREVGGVRMFNDNNATTPEATIAALDALPNNVILIMGGADKGLDMATLLERARLCKKVVLLAGSGTEKIRSELPNAPVFDALESALRAALDAAAQGDTILFSPAYASFGMFKNEYDRNDQFLKAVRAL